MRFQAAALKYGSGSTDDQAVENRILPVGCVLMGRPVRDGEPEPSSERGQRERQHETVVKTIGEEEEEAGGRQQIEIPLSGKHMKPLLDVREFHGPNEAAEVKHVIEYQTGRRSFPRGPGGRAGEAVPKTGGEHCGEDGQHEDVAQLLRPGADGPAEAGDER